MDLEKARELYKEQFNRRPSSKMKLENIVAKLNLIENKQAEEEATAEDLERIQEEMKEEKP